jgi:hypothetical protein
MDINQIPTDTSQPPTHEATPTATPETVEQKIERVAKTEVSAGAKVNDFSSWRATPEGRKFAEIMFEPNSRSEDELLQSDAFIRAMRLAEYDQIINTGRGTEDFASLQSTIFYAMAGFANNHELADEILTFNKEELKHYLHTSLSPTELTYIEIMRQATGKDTIILTPLERAQIEFDKEYVLFHAEWENGEAVGNGVYGFYYDEEEGQFGTSNFVTLKMFGKSQLGNVPFEMTVEQFYETVGATAGFGADFVGIADLGNSKYAMLFFMRGIDGSSHFWLQQVVLEGDQTMIFDKNSEYYAGAWGTYENVEIPTITIQTIYWIADGKPDYASSYHPLTLDIMKQFLHGPPFNYVKTTPSSISALWTDNDGRQFNFNQYAFIDEQTGLPVYGNNLNGLQAARIVFGGIVNPFPQ